MEPSAAAAESDANRERRGIQRAMGIIGHGGHLMLSPREAAHILQHCRFPTQDRDLKTAGLDHQSVLAEAMRSGMWRERDTLSFLRVNNRLYLGDGHHRLGAQVMVGIDIRWNVEIYECESFGEAAVLYTTFNSLDRRRTDTQRLVAVGATAETGLSSRLLTRMYRAMPLLVNGLRTSNRDRADMLTERLFQRRYRYMVDLYTAPAHQLQACIKGASKVLYGKITTQGSLAVALLTMKYQPDKAAEFWRGIAQNDGLRKGDPRHAYVTAMLTSRVSENNSLGSLGAARSAWNAWWSGKPLTFIRPGGVHYRKLHGVPSQYEGSPVPLDGGEE